MNDFSAGNFQIGDSVTPLNPADVKSVVYYGRLRYPLHHEATGYSLVYSQLYPFEGLQNYTSGIIHHVRLTGSLISIFIVPCLETSVNYNLLFETFLGSNF